MKHITIEVLGENKQGEFTCLVSAPTFGASHEPQGKFDRRVVLNDGQHRVIMGIYNGAKMNTEQLQSLAREVVNRYI
jgi:hypothetical protein